MVDIRIYMKDPTMDHKNNTWNIYETCVLSWKAARNRLLFYSRMEMLLEIGMYPHT